MIILGIDTTTPDGGVALVNEAGLIAAHRFGTEVGRAARLLPAMDALLSDHGMTFFDVEGIAVSVGPGSYTGARVGLASAQGLSLGRDVPIMPVGTLEAYATAYSDQNAWIVPLLPARRDEAYWALFEQTPHGLTRLQPDTVSTWDAVLNNLNALNHDLLLVGCVLHVDRFSTLLGKRCTFPPQSAPLYLATHVAREGLRRFLIGEQPGAVLPNYLSLFPRKPTPKAG